ncbi:hypothetical protein ACFE04_031688 [Oxalis oulophora]
MNRSQTLIPGLPNDVASLILAFIPYSYHSIMKSTAKSWYVFFSSKTVDRLRRQHNKLSHLLCFFPQDPSIHPPCLFDPVNLAWRHLRPMMPCNPSTYGLTNFVPLSYGHHLYIIGGSLFDARSFPLDRPLASNLVFRFNFITSTWDELPPMLHPRGSFACALDMDANQIVVAGGGSRHSMFVSAGSRISFVERYDVGRNEWVEMDELPRFRAGCVGFFVKNGDDHHKEFWVLGGYGDSRTVSGVFPVDDYYTDGAVMTMKTNNACMKWREVADIWGEGVTARVGKIVVSENQYGNGVPDVFMLDLNDIFRYEMSSNRWVKETTVPKKAPSEKPFGFVALNGELHVMIVLEGSEPPENRRKGRYKKGGTLYGQIYNPKKKKWRFLVANLPLNHRLDFGIAEEKLRILQKLSWSQIGLRPN